MIDDFIERKWGRRAVEYMLPELEPMLRETLGVMVYQEQVMQICGGDRRVSLGGADLLRRAMGKKDPAEMAKQRETLYGGRGGEEVSEGEGGQDLRPDGEVCGVWVQQVALGGVCAAGVSHGLAEDALSGGVHGGAADERNIEAGECGEVHLGVPRDEDSGGAAECAGVAMRTLRR